MSAEVDQGSAVEPLKIEMSAKNTSSGASSTSGPRASIFAAKSGFVIPKNKLSGSLIPIFRGVKKPGNDAANDDSTNQVRRKSKWGPDPTQDAAVRRGRALAYQTRIDQITEQLMSGILEPEETQSSQAADLPANFNISAPQMDFKVSELLNLERQEIIGEILKLNPSFKTPPDYVPLLKEATVSIPIKDYPGYNFVGLVFGPGSESQKRLEKETKAKVQVFGTKANTGEKVEISASNVNESQDAYKELNVHVSADTFEKVDAAVALIELLLTSVSENFGAAGSNQNHSSSAQGTVGPARIPQQGQFHFQGLSLGFNPVHNNSRPDPSFYGSQLIKASGFNSIPPSVQPQMQARARSYRKFHIRAPQPVIASQPLSLMPSERPFSSSGWPSAPHSVGPRPVTPQPAASFSSAINVPMNHHHVPVPINSLVNSPHTTAASQQPTGCFPGNTANPTLPPHSGLGNFTFRPPNPRPINQDVFSMQTPSSFRLGPPNPMPPSPGSMYVFARQQLVNQMAHRLPGASFAAFLNASGPVVVPPVRNLNQRPDLAGNHPLQRMAPPPPNVFAPNHQLTARHLYPSNPGPGGAQIYDPFSPTSTK